MATHASAKKRARQSEKRRLRNRDTAATMKSAIRKLKEAIEKKDLSKLDELFRMAQSEIAVARKKGLIHVNNMARKISRFAKQMNKAKDSSK